MIKYQTPPPKTIILKMWDEQVIISIQVPVTMLFFYLTNTYPALLMCWIATVLS